MRLESKSDGLSSYHELQRCVLVISRQKEDFKDVFLRFCKYFTNQQKLQNEKKRILAFFMTKIQRKISLNKKK